MACAIAYASANLAFAIPSRDHSAVQRVYRFDPSNRGRRMIMRDVDPQLMKLRGVEARIALAEFHLREQEELLERMEARGLDTSLALEMLETMRQAVAIFRKRQDTLLSMMCTAPSPLQAVTAPDSSAAASLHETR
jgi:hypothetical protein